MNFKSIIQLLKLYDEDRENREQIKELIKAELNKLNDDTVEEIKVLRNEFGLKATMQKKYSYNTYDMKIKYSGATNKIYMYIDENRYCLEFAV